MKTDYAADIMALNIGAQKPYLVMEKGKPKMSELAGKQRGLLKYLEGLGSWLTQNSASGNMRPAALQVIIKHTSGSEQAKARELLKMLGQQSSDVPNPSGRTIPGSEQPARLSLLNEMGDKSFIGPLPQRSELPAPALFSSLSSLARRIEEGAKGEQMLLFCPDHADRQFWTWCLDALCRIETRSRFLYELRKHLYLFADVYVANQEQPFARIQLFTERHLQPAINDERSWLASDERYELVRRAAMREELRLSEDHGAQHLLSWHDRQITARELNQQLAQQSNVAAQTRALGASYIERYHVTAYGPSALRSQAVACRYFPDKRAFSHAGEPQLVLLDASAKPKAQELEVFNHIALAHSLDFGGRKRPSRLFGGLDLSSSWLIRKTAELANQPCHYPAADRGKVLVVGAGNSGLLAALTLRSIGFDVEIIEKLRQPSDRWQALFLTDDTLMLLEHLGVLDRLTLTVHAEAGGSVLINELEDALTKKLEELHCNVRRGLEVSGIEGETFRIKNLQAESSFALGLSDYSSVLVADGSSHSIFKMTGGKVERSTRVAFAMLARADKPLRNPQRLHVDADPGDFEVRLFSHSRQTYMAVELSHREYQEWSQLQKEQSKKLLSIAQELLLSQDHKAQVLAESINVFKIQPSRLPAGQLVGQLGQTPLFYIGDAAVQGHFMLGSTFNTHVRSLVFLRQHLLPIGAWERRAYVQLATENHERLWQLAQACFFRWD